LKVIISYPPLKNEKGYATLGQNRQFQYFKAPTYIYPVVPAQAAALLKQNGFEVIWNDCIAEDILYQDFLKFIEEEKPDLVAFESKTPVIKYHWKVINELKSRMPALKIVLFGDHVTALPEESFQNSKVDFVLTGGDYDFLLLNLCKVLNGLSTDALEPGIYYRKNCSTSLTIKNTGSFQLNHDLNTLPFIDRELTKWQLYAYKNGNYRRTPGTYIMSGRDCYWGKCTFCLTPNMKIITSKGAIPIKDIVNKDGKEFKALTHTGRFKEVIKRFKRPYKGKILDIEIYNFKQNLQLTPNHKIFALRRENIKRCSKRSCWDYLCIPSRISSRLKCKSCEKKYYQSYRLEFVEAAALKKNDFVAIPINRKIKDVKNINVKRAIDINDFVFETDRRISDEKISNVVNYHNIGFSQEKISKLLSIDRETVKRYIALFKNNALDTERAILIEKDGYIKFKRGKKWLPKNIPLTNEFMRLVGYYLAEESVSKIKNRPNSYALVLTFSEKEEDFINDVVTIAEEIFKKVDIRKYRNKANKTIQISISSSLLAVIFKNMFGDNCYAKKIPLEFLYLPLVKQKELIKGAFRGDGHLRIRDKGEGSGEYIYETTSSVLAQQLIFLLLRQDLIPRFRICKPGKKETALKYSISLCQYDIQKIFPDFDLPKRSRIFRSGFILGNHAMIPIKNIKETFYSGYVYNLEIEDDHSYSANNIAVGNCSWPQLYPHFRVRKPENVLDEIEYIVDNYPVKEIMDDTGSITPGDWLKGFCNGMIERGLNKRVTLDCNIRFGSVDYETYKLMRRGGFRFLLFGLESANQSTLDRVKKNLKVETIIQSCRDAKRAGLYPHITIMFGYPWETYEDAQNTLELGKWLLKKGYAYTMQATIVIPYPNTPLFKECKERGLLYTLDWTEYDMKRPVMKLSYPTDDLHKLVQGMYSVSFSPEFIIRKIFSIKDIYDIRYFWRAFLKVIGHIKDFNRSKQDNE